MGNFLTSQGIYATHILSAPLLRALETAYWTFEDLIKSGVKVLAIPELQSMSNGPNGTGMDLNQLKELYGDDTHNPREFSDPKPPEALDLDTKFGAKQADEPKPGAKDAKGDVPSSAETTRTSGAQLTSDSCAKTGTTQSKSQKNTMENIQLLRRDINILEDFSEVFALA